MAALPSERPLKPECSPGVDAARLLGACVAALAGWPPAYVQPMSGQLSSWQESRRSQS